MSDKEMKMATIYLFGKKYDVPAELTIRNAMDETRAVRSVDSCGVERSIFGGKNV